MPVNLHNSVLPELLNPFPIMSDRLERFRKPPAVHLSKNAPMWNPPKLRVSLTRTYTQAPGTKPCYGCLYAVKGIRA